MSRMRSFIDIAAGVFSLLEAKATPAGGPPASDLPTEAHEVRRFDLAAVGNRRFMFDPRRKTFILGHARGTGRGGGIVSSHAEEYHDVRGSNAGFDKMVRGWVGHGGSYRNGVIHFAPEIGDYNFDVGMDALEAFQKCGASAKTVVRGFPGAFEQPLGKIIE